MAYPVNVKQCNFRVMGEYIVPAVYWDENDELIAHDWKDFYDISSSTPMESSSSYQTSDSLVSAASAYVHSSVNYFAVSSDASSQNGWMGARGISTIIFLTFS